MSEKVVYKIINKINDKKYIGSTKDKKKRWKEHRRKLRKGCHENIYLQRSWDKYGSINFEFSVVEKVDKSSNLIEREQYYMDEFESEYNIVPKADGSEMSEDTRAKISESKKGEKHPLYGEHRSEETKRRIGEGNKGKELSKKTKRKISENHADMSGKNNPFYGKTHSQEIREKLRKANEGENNPNWGKTGEDASNNRLTKKKVKVIKHLLEGGQFKQSEIGDMYGVNQTAISKIAVGRTWPHVEI